ncbi:IDEAL domain-containing protein [Oceanobacillus sp. FSL H7-0719]|uniref:IDEAL domain-containing protein n=1 Tax=Oceanobacillus sp. FSL H7-0719 TaxID=2954507 RepID=UPI003255596A
MKKEKVVLLFFRYEGKPIQAKREIPYEIRLQAQMMLDEICFQYNRKKLEEELNGALDERNKTAFIQHSEAYKEFIWK